MSAPARLISPWHTHPGFVEGARNAVFTCLAVRPGERAVLITDLANREIGAALAAEFRPARPSWPSFVLEEIAAAPAHRAPGADGRRLWSRRTSAATPRAPRGRARRAHRDDGDREPAPHAARAHGEHHAAHHARGDARRFPAVDALSPLGAGARAAGARASSARRRAGSAPARSTFDPEIRWLKTSGLISREKWGNLPGGEVLTAPGARRRRVRVRRRARRLARRASTATWRRPAARSRSRTRGSWGSTASARTSWPTSAPTPASTRTRTASASSRWGPTWRSRT